MTVYASSLAIPKSWAPGHYGITAKEATNPMAASATLVNTVDTTIVSYTELIPHIRQQLRIT